MAKFKGKTAIVTGAASGIGKALAEQLAKKGAHVVLADIQFEEAEKVAAAIRSAGGSAESSFLDVTDAEEFRSLVEETAAARGRLDYLFNNAGIAVVGPAEDFSLEDWNRTIDVNIRGVVHGVHAALPVMLRQRDGHIVNTASLAGLIPSPSLAAYSMSKHAVVGLSVSLRAEVAGRGVRVSAICPGFVNTAILTDSKRVTVDAEYTEPAFRVAISPEEAARQTLRGVSRNEPTILVTGHARMASLTHRLIPAVTHAVARGAARRLKRTEE